MTFIDANGLDFVQLNNAIRESRGDCTLLNCLGQRFIGAGMSGRSIIIKGVPGNALGAYLSGAEIVVDGNVQDAVGDTMDSGTIEVGGNIGDAAGYAMRGGEMYIKGNAGYRAGIHMKQYKDKKPVIVIGGRAGSFLGEYQAGGLIIVLGLHDDGKPIVGNFPCTGMHGGKMLLRGDTSGIIFPGQTNARTAGKEDMEEILPFLEEYSRRFGVSMKTLLEESYTVITPDSKNPYKQMYVGN